MYLSCRCFSVLCWSYICRLISLFVKLGVPCRANYKAILQSVCKDRGFSSRTSAGPWDSLCMCPREARLSIRIVSKLLVTHRAKLPIRELGPTGRDVLRLEYCRYSIMVIMRPCHGWDAGSIPVTCSIQKISHSYSGSTSAFQADGVGSIPTCGSMCL